MRSQRGQALVLVLLSLAVVLTLVLFVLARSTTDIAVSSRSEEAARAFSAAEAGIENALVVGAGSPGSVGDATYLSSVIPFAEGKTEFNYPIELTSGDTMTTWFADHNEDGTLKVDPPDFPHFAGDTMKVCWGRSGTPVDANSPAVEISVFYEASPPSLGSTQIGRATFDPYSSRNPGNSFTSAGGIGCQIDGVNYAFQGLVTFSGATGIGVNTNGLLFARTRMFYNSDSQPVGVVVEGGLLPSQGQDISSTGSIGDSNRKVQVFQGWPEVPQVFDYAIYSGSSDGLRK